MAGIAQGADADDRTLARRGPLERAERWRGRSHFGRRSGWDVIASLLVTNTVKPMIKQILIVDDDISFVSAARRALKAAGYEPVLASNIADAETVMEQGSPHLILLSPSVGDGEGLFILELLRQGSDGDSLPVVFIGDGRGEIRDLESAKEHGGAGYLEKPMNWGRLMAELPGYFREAPSPGEPGEIEAAEELEEVKELEEVEELEELEEVEELEEIEVLGESGAADGPEGSGKQDEAEALEELEEVEDFEEIREVEEAPEEKEPEESQAEEALSEEMEAEESQAEEALSEEKIEAEESQAEEALSEEIEAEKTQTEENRGLFEEDSPVAQGVLSEVLFDHGDEEEAKEALDPEEEGERPLGSMEALEEAESQAEESQGLFEEDLSGDGTGPEVPVGPDAEVGRWGETTLQADWRSAAPTKKVRSRLGGGWGVDMPEKIELDRAEEEEILRASRLPEIPHIEGKPLPRQDRAVVTTGDDADRAADPGEASGVTEQGLQAPAQDEMQQASFSDPFAGSTPAAYADLEQDGPLADAQEAPLAEEQTLQGSAGIEGEAEAGFDETDFGGLLDDEEEEEPVLELSPEMLDSEEGEYDPMAAKDAAFDGMPPDESSAPGHAAVSEQAGFHSDPNEAGFHQGASSEYEDPPAAQDQYGGALGAAGAGQAPPHHFEMEAPSASQDHPPAQLDEQPARTSFAGEGDLASFDLPHLLAETWRSRGTGLLEIHGPDGLRHVYWELGRPVAVLSDRLEEQLPEVAFRLGRVLKEHVDDVLGRGISVPRRQAMHLVETGALKAQEMYDTVRAQAHAALFGAFGLEEGSWRWLPESCPDELKVALPEHPFALVTEGIRRKLSLATIHRRLGGPATVLASSQAPELHLLGLTARERRLAEQVDGFRTAEELVFLSGLGEEATYQILYSLVATGQATVKMHGPMPEGRASTPEQRQSEVEIDRRRIEQKFRQALECDYLELLGVPPEATAYEIKTAHESLSRLFHPGRYPGDEYKDLWGKLEEIRRAIDDAHDVLKDEILRADYLDSLKARRRGA